MLWRGKCGLWYSAVTLEIEYCWCHSKVASKIKCCHRFGRNHVKMLSKHSQSKFWIRSKNSTRCKAHLMHKKWILDVNVSMSSVRCRVLPELWHGNFYHEFPTFPNISENIENLMSQVTTHSKVEDLDVSNNFADNPNSP